MVYQNGRIPLDKLTPIGDGLYLEHKAAVAWISARADVFAETGIMPVVSSPDGAYRDYVGQVRQKALAIADGQSWRAAAPGFSTHGEGLSVDIWNISRYNLAQLERILARFGFRRNIPRESWHFTHDGTTTAGTTGTEIGDTLSAEDTAALGRIESMLKSTHAGLWYGGTSGGKEFGYGALPIVTHNQTLIVQLHAKVAALTAAVGALAGGTSGPGGITAAQVEDAVNRAVADEFAAVNANIDQIPTGFKIIADNGS